MRLAAFAMLLVLAQTGAASANFDGLLHHARTKNLEGVRALLEQGADPNPPHTWYDGYTPLMFAAGNGDAEMTRLLLEAGALTELRDHNRERALQWAAGSAYRNHYTDTPEAVRLLLEAGSPPDSDEDRYGVSPLMQASDYGGDEDVVRLLLAAGADATRIDGGGSSALHRAAYYDSAIAGLLLEAGADPNARESALGTTPLHQAAWGGVVRNIRLLVAAGAEIEPRRYRGETALFIAAAHGHRAAVEALVELGAEVDAAAGNGLTPILAAITGGSDSPRVDHESAALALAAHTADIDRAFAAALWGRRTAVAALLADRDADPNARDHRGRSALAGTSELSGMAWFERLVEQADLAAHGAETLHAASARGRHPMISRLLRMGVGVDARSGSGATALLHAAAAGRVGTVRLLLDYGADPAATDHVGQGAESYMAGGRKGLEAAIAHAEASRAFIDVSSERRRLARLVAAQAEIRVLLGL